jgi:hypothetical protein
LGWQQLACGLFSGTFTPIGLALRMPLEYRFPFSPPDPQASLDGIILLAGGGIGGIDAMSTLSKDYPKARLIFSGFKATDPFNEYLLTIFARLGGDPARIYRMPSGRHMGPSRSPKKADKTASAAKPVPNGGSPSSFVLYRRYVCENSRGRCRPVAVIHPSHPIVAKQPQVDLAGRHELKHDGHRLQIHQSGKHPLSDSRQNHATYLAVRPDGAPELRIQHFNCMYEIFHGSKGWRSQRSLPVE